MTDTHTTPEKPRRRWLRFSLRGLMIVVLLMCVPLAWIAQKYSRMRIEDAVVAEILSADGTVIYPYQKTSSPNGGFAKDPSQPAPGPKWLREHLGENIFASVHCVWLLTDKFGDELVARLPQLDDLEVLSLRSSSLTDSSVDSLLKVSRLEELTLDADHISPQGLNRLSSHPTLRSLSLYGRLASPTQIRQLEPWPSLQELEIHTTMASDKDLSQLAGCKSLRKLALYYLPEVKLLDPSLLEQMTMLEELTVIGSGVSDNSLSHIAQRTQLKTLNLKRGDITDDGLRLLNPLTKLKTLTLRETMVTAEGLQALSEMKSLEEIIVSRNQQIPAGKLGSANILVR